jgi:hypothetical protein
MRVVVLKRKFKSSSLKNPLKLTLSISFYFFPFLAQPTSLFLFFQPATTTGPAWPIFTAAHLLSFSLFLFFFYFLAAAHIYSGPTVTPAGPLHPLPLSHAP